MRECGACRRPIRWDESLNACWLRGGWEDRRGDAVGPGMYSACPRCIAAEEGREPPIAPKYPPGRVPRHPYRDDYLPVCGLCREALFEGENNRLCRVSAEDVEESGVLPAAYAMCPRCWARWSPIVLARWKREGVVPQSAEPMEPMA